MVYFETMVDMMTKPGKDPRSRWLSSGEARLLRGAQVMDVVEVPEGWAICAEDVPPSPVGQSVWCYIHSDTFIHEFNPLATHRILYGRPMPDTIHLRRMTDRWATFVFNEPHNNRLVYLQAESVCNYPVSYVKAAGEPTLITPPPLPKDPVRTACVTTMAAGYVLRPVATPLGVMNIPCNWMVISNASLAADGYRKDDILGFTSEDDSGILLQPGPLEHRCLMGEARQGGVSPLTPLSWPVTIRLCDLQNPAHRIGFYNPAADDEKRVVVASATLDEHAANIKAQMKFFFGCSPTSDAVKNIAPPRVIDTWPDSECEW